MAASPPGASSEGLGQFSVRTELGDGTAVLHLAGEIDVETAPHFAAAMASLDPATHRTIVLDLSAVEFLDSSGLYRMVVALKRQREQGGDLVLRAPRAPVRRVLDIVGLTNVLTIEG